MLKFTSVQRGFLKHFKFFSSPLSSKSTEFSILRFCFGLVLGFRTFPKNTQEKEPEETRGESVYVRRSRIGKNQGKPSNWSTSEKNLTFTVFIMAGQPTPPNVPPPEIRFECSALSSETYDQQALIIRPYFTEGLLFFLGN